MLEVIPSSQFKKDLKRLNKQSKKLSLLESPIYDFLAQNKALPPEYKDHSLSGNYANHREFHIGGRNSDWLVIYRITSDAVYLVRTGSHSELF
jgi:mRNA interferase YafQ